MSVMTDEIKGWVGCLGCYNSGDLVGRWLTADQAQDLHGSGLTSGVGRCVRCGAEEFDVFVTDGVRHPGGYYSVESFVADAEALESIEVDYERPALVSLADHWGVTLSEAVVRFGDAFLGCWDTLEDYAHDYAESCIEGYEGDSVLARYFDLDAFARDLELGGDVWTAPADGGQVFVFAGWA